MTLWTILYALAFFLATTVATPTVTYPINSQLPLVARLSERFSYTFSISTFSSSLPITYTLSNAPSWLSLNSDTRTLFGTPTPNDVGDETVTSFGVGLTASDQSGSVTLNSTFVISKGLAPVVSIPLSSQLPYLGRYSAPSTLLLQQSAAFKIDFQPDTFSNRGSNTTISYYATSTTNTPLPSWLIFDDALLSLIGETPNYPGFVGVQIIASDVEGFSGSSISLELAIGVHTLAFSNQTMVLNAIPGAHVIFDDLSNNLELDGQPTDVSSLASITAQTPPWLSFDNSTLTISGYTPADVAPCNITVRATNIYGEAAVAIIAVDIASTSSTSIDPPIAPPSVLATSHTHFSKGIIAAIVVPTILLFLTILGVLIWCRCRRRSSSQQNGRPFTTDQYYFSRSSDIEDIAGMPPAVRPKCLRLDAFKYVDSSWTSPYTTEYNGKKGMARAKTSMEQSGEGLLVPNSLVPEPLDLVNYGSRNRAGTLDTLHRSKPSWGSTLTSIMPTVRSRANSSGRQASDCSPCSERGTRRPGRVSLDQSLRGMHFFRRHVTELTLKSRDSTISFGALINFPILPEMVDGQEKPRPEPSEVGNTILKPMRRRSRSLPTIPPLYSTRRFERPVSMLALAGETHNGRNAEEVHEWVDGRSVTRNSSSWVTFNTKDEKRDRSSSLNLSATAESLYHGEEGFQGPSEQQRESLIPSACHTAEIDLLWRKSNKRSGSSSFCGASSAKRSRQLSEQSATTSGDVVLYPETSMDTSGIEISKRSEKGGTPQDSFESSFSSAREGTRQLKSYIQSLLRRTLTQDSVKSNDASDGLSVSARDSLSSVENFPGVRDSRGSEVKCRIEEEGHKSLLTDAASEWSWETHYTQHDDKETVIGDGSKDSPTTESRTVAAMSSHLGSRALDIDLKDERVPIGGSRRIYAKGMNDKTTKKAPKALLDYGEGGSDDITHYF